MATANNLGSLQARLNKDLTLKSKFIKDPVGTLKSEGVALDADMAKQLKSFVASARTRPPEELRRIKIVIKIGIEF